MYNTMIPVSFPLYLSLSLPQFPMTHSFLFLMQRYPTDRAYFIAKEILMTERTYKKDLEIINLVSTISQT